MLEPELVTAPTSRKGMTLIRGDLFRMGSDSHYAEEAPSHRVSVDDFWIDDTPVTNRQFRAFVEATGHVTMAEIAPDPKDYPGALPHMLKAGSLVFTPPDYPVDTRDWSQWWSFRFRANWRRPYGPGSSIKGLDDHPVVHVAYRDAEAYAAWVGKALPTEAEWEFAARGGLDRKPYAWGDQKEPGGKIMANIWTGEFPNENSAKDGWAQSAPVKSFPANGYGLYDISGNVWEWTADWYRPDYYKDSPEKNPQGPVDSYDPGEAGLPKKVMRGGSFLCSDNYCLGYQPGIRSRTTPDTALQHLGFRCVKSP